MVWHSIALALVSWLQLQLSLLLRSARLAFLCPDRLLLEFIVFLGGCADGLSSAVSFSIAIAFAALAAAVAPSAFFYYVILSFALVLIRSWA